MDITVTARLVLDDEDNDDEDAIAGGDEKACFHRSAAVLDRWRLSFISLRSVISGFRSFLHFSFPLWCFFKKQKVLWTTDASKHLKGNPAVEMMAGREEEEKEGVEEQEEG